jgi:hypothetical protein
VLYPYKYLQAEQFEGSCPFVFLNQLYDQNYAIFLKDGTLVDSHYYAGIKIVEPNTYDGYLVCFHDEYEALRCEYDLDKQEIIKTRILQKTIPIDLSTK